MPFSRALLKLRHSQVYLVESLSTNHSSAAVIAVDVFAAKGCIKLGQLVPGQIGRRPGAQVEGPGMPRAELVPGQDEQPVEGRIEEAQAAFREMDELTGRTGHNLLLTDSKAGMAQVQRLQGKLPRLAVAHEAKAGSPARMREARV